MSQEIALFGRLIGAEKTHAMTDGFKGYVVNREMIDQGHRNSLQPIFQSLSAGINAYAEKTKEMLPKTPEKLMDAFFAGQSCIFVAVNQREEIVPVGHASCSPLYTNNDTRVIEFGGWFVDDKHRHNRLNGLTIGETVGLAAIEQAQLNCQQDNVRPIIIATVKRANALKGLVDHLGFKIDSFHRRPFTTTLTCVCSDTSEHFNCTACVHRRGPGNGELFTQNAVPSMRYQFNDVQTPNGTDVMKIPCTLLVHESSDIDSFEKSMMDSFAGQEYNGLIAKSSMMAHKGHLISLGQII